MRPTAVFCPGPAPDLVSVAAAAREAGFAAVELTADDRADAVSVTNLLWSSATAIARKIGDLSVGSVATPGDWDSIRRGIDAAASVGCRLVRAAGVRLLTRREVYKTARETGDLAAAAGVVVAIELTGTRHGTTDLWTFLDAVGHPDIGCCWAGTDSVTADVSIPVLSNHIRAARITADDRAAIDRLHGIGFQGPWVVGPTRDAKLVRDFFS